MARSRIPLWLGILFIGASLVAVWRLCKKDVEPFTNLALNPTVITTATTTVSSATMVTRNKTTGKYYFGNVNTIAEWDPSNNTRKVLIGAGGSPFTSIPDYPQRSTANQIFTTPPGFAIAYIYSDDANNRLIVVGFPFAMYCLIINTNTYETTKINVPGNLATINGHGCAVNSLGHIYISTGDTSGGSFTFSMKFSIYKIILTTNGWSIRLVLGNGKNDGLPCSTGNRPIRILSTNSWNSSISGTSNDTKQVEIAVTGQPDANAFTAPVINNYFAHSFKAPRGLAFDSSDTLYFPDQENGCVFKFTTSGVLTKIADIPSGSEPYSIIVDTDGTVYVGGISSRTIWRINQTTTPPTLNTITTSTPVTNRTIFMVESGVVGTTNGTNTVAYGSPQNCTVTTQDNCVSSSATGCGPGTIRTNYTVTSPAKYGGTCPASSVMTSTACFVPVTESCKTTGATGTKVSCGAWGAYAGVGATGFPSSNVIYFLFDTEQEILIFMDEVAKLPNGHILATSYYKTIGSYTIPYIPSPNTIPANKFFYIRTNAADLTPTFAGLSYTPTYKGSRTSMISLPTFNLQIRDRTCSAVQSCTYPAPTVTGQPGTTDSFAAWTLADAQWECDNDPQCLGVYIKDNGEFHKFKGTLGQGSATVYKKADGCHTCNPQYAAGVTCVGAAACGPCTYTSPAISNTRGPRGPATCPLASTVSRSGFNPLTGDCLTQAMPDKTILCSTTTVTVDSTRKLIFFNSKQDLLTYLPTNNATRVGQIVSSTSLTTAQQTAIGKWYANVSSTTTAFGTSFLQIQPSTTPFTFIGYDYVWTSNPVNGSEGAILFTTKDAMLSYAAQIFSSITNFGQITANAPTNYTYSTGLTSAQTAGAWFIKTTKALATAANIPGSIGNLTVPSGELRHMAILEHTAGSTLCRAVSSCGYSTSPGTPTDGAFAGWTLAEAQIACDSDELCKGVYVKSGTQGFFKINAFNTTTGSTSASVKDPGCYTCTPINPNTTPCTSPSPLQKCGPGVVRTTYGGVSPGARAPLPCPAASFYTTASPCTNTVFGVNADPTCTASSPNAKCTTWPNPLEMNASWVTTATLTGWPSGKATLYNNFADAQLAIEEVREQRARAGSLTPVYVIEPTDSQYVIKQIATNPSTGQFITVTANDVNCIDPGLACFQTNRKTANNTPCLANNGACGPGTQTVSFPDCAKAPRGTDCPGPSTGVACPTPACPTITGPAFVDTRFMRPFNAANSYKEQCGTA